MTTASTTSLIERVERLERQNRRMKQAGAAVLVVAAVLFLMGQAAPLRTVEANKFVLTDSDGRVRGVLSTNEQNAMLQLFDVNGQLRSWMPLGGLVFHDNSGSAKAAVSTNNEEAMIDLHGRSRSVATIGVDANGPAVILADKDGFQATVGATDLVTPSTGETYKRTTASIALSNKDKKVLWKAP
jgi:hypothetical protein